MRNVLVLFGGVSPEHEVSLRSAASVLSQIDRTRNAVTTVGITKDGRWLYTEADCAAIEDGSWEKQTGIPAMLSCDRSDRGLYLFENGRTRRVPVDVVLPMLHGENGEDGRMQGLFELAGLPFVGPGMRASVCAMDKALTKVVLAAAGIRQADYLVMRRTMDRERIVAQVESRFCYPVFVKPCGTGSSCGVSKAKNRSELLNALQLAFQYDEKLLVEEFIEGREIEVAVLGGRDGVYASCPGEICSGVEFYDYEAKYLTNTSTCHIPAELPAGVAQDIRETACRVFEALECHGHSRVDFFVLPDGSFLLNEVNTLPGFTSISMYPKLMMYAQNLTYPELIEKLLESAEETK